MRFCYSVQLGATRCNSVHLRYSPFHYKNDKKCKSISIFFLKNVSNEIGTNEIGTNDIRTYEIRMR